MPRVTRGRTVEAEAMLQGPDGVIAEEREKRGWSYQDLADRMRDEGCPIAKSALFKIEAAEAPRGVGVDELVAFAAVFGTPPAVLLTPREQRRSKRIKKLVRAHDDAMTKLARATETVLNTYIESVELLADDPEAWESVGHRLSGFGASITVRDPFPDELFRRMWQVVDTYVDGLLELAKTAARKGGQ